MSERFKRFNPSMGQSMIKWGLLKENTPYLLFELDQNQDADTHDLEAIVLALVTVKMEYTEDHLRRIWELDYA